MEKMLIGNNEIAFDYKIKDGCVIGTFHTDFIDLSIAKKLTEYRLTLQKG